MGGRPQRQTGRLPRHLRPSHGQRTVDGGLQEQEGGFEGQAVSGGVQLQAGPRGRAELERRGRDRGAGGGGGRMVEGRAEREGGRFSVEFRRGDQGRREQGGSR